MSSSTIWPPPGRSASKARMIGVETVSTPLNKFETVRVEFEENAALSIPKQTVWFASDVGVVKIQVADKEAAELVGYSVQIARR